MANKKVLIPLAQGCEELEAVTIIDILVRGGVEVVTASLDDNRTITASRGVQIVAQTSLESVMADSFDMMILPGGIPGADNLEKDLRIIEKLKQTSQQGGFVSAICAAPKVLVKAGLLDNKKATSYPGFINVNPAKGMSYIDLPVVEDSNIVTSRGPGTALDFSLALLEKLEGSITRQQVEAALLRP
jgi:4-methyl-5(b-hydroxyethyl)-thiazole monophosphate biosynthesis